ncbi:hypothetical protein BB734_04425 [Mycobacterium avium subsp. hominissuis]|uniref:NmrA-like domain-containing protein n=2 Tax=Mycobacterium avium TaxID=1764 RepID=A0A2A3L9K6_MYCAV|nr:MULTISPECIES: NmrA family NAD(P)-binding protein [Mycobacterium]ETZ56491.1 NAD dependent epimerase/dehydratase family protein [Mycobacterium avium MAV_120709_2344]PBA25262.1 hypothetical protein CKJ66_19420 [Mycobacterium avium]MCQ4363656.1 NmrA family NAD(P)-binding protein [Mycobacterium gordonae]PBA40380.1 hypothetical protein CKJ63_17830 [Mycobacterium avium]PBD11457.1 hypothetical protein BI295_20025 [Mycobacterium avium subsp. hominissuis]
MRSLTTPSQPNTKTQIAGDFMTNTSKDPIVVIGATGQQGSATVDALVDRGMAVRALTRSVDSAAARALAGRGVEVVEAELDAPDSIRRAFEGAGAAFAMTSLLGPRGVDGEVAHGKVIVEAAHAAQLPFLVYSSVGGAERKSGVPHFESKRRVEEFLIGAVPANIIRPAFFMENLLEMIDRKDGKLAFSMAMPGNVPLQMISVRDIGSVAATLLVRRDSAAAPVEIAGDEVSGEQIANLVAQRFGESATFVELPLDVFGDDDDGRAMFRWFSDPPSYRADFARTRDLGDDVEDLSRWLARQPSPYSEAQS